MMLRILIILLILSVVVQAQDHENVDLIGRYYTCWNSGNDVAIQGEHAYIAAGYSGIQIVDISNPVQPVGVGHYDNNLEYAKSIFISGNYAYVVDSHNGFQVIDISDPTSPNEIGFLISEAYRFENIYVNGDHAYMTVYEGGALGYLQIVDISNPENPELVGIYDSPGRIMGTFVLGDHAYIAASSGGFRVIDVSDPENPEEIGDFDTEGAAVSVFVSGDYAYVGFQRSGLCVIDISDPTNMSQVGGCDGLYAADIVVSEDNAFVVNQDGFRVVDISDPREPNVIGAYYIDGYSRNLFVSGNYAFVPGLYSDERFWVNRGFLYVIDISNPTDPDDAGLYYTLSDARDVFVSGDFVFVAAGYGGLSIVDISEPGNLREAGCLVIEGYTCGVFVSGGYAYMAGGESGLRVIDVSDPTSPDDLGSFNTQGWCRNVFISENIAYVADKREGLRLIDVSNPTELREVGSHEGRFNDVFVFEGYAYVADEDSCFRIIDVSDPTNPDEVSACDTPYNAYGVTISESIAYVVGYDSWETFEGFFMMIDVTDPTNPEILSSLGNLGDIKSVSINGDLAYLAGGISGLRVINVSDPEQPQEVGYYNTSEKVWGVASSEEGLIYVADRTNVGIYHFTPPDAVTDCDDGQFPGVICLSPAYPHPFNSTTIIRYNLPLAMDVSLTIYDPLGRRITTLFEGYRQAGFHSVSLKAGDLSSGLYFVGLKGSGQMLSRKILLIR
ncbi:MAG: T9SS type A sorting domain-containing protein [Calditrichaeota bacterium]|nr:T9SS type A sorting domain-containing protein [Calditrichota bacterium]